MGLIIYVSLLLLTPKVLSLPFGPQDNAFLSWAHSYAAFSQSIYLPGLWSALLFTSGRLPVVDISTSKKDFLQVCKYFQQQSHVMSLLHLMTSNNPKMDGCNTLYFNYGHNVTFNFDYIHCLDSMTILLYLRQMGLDPNGFLPDVYQIWDEVIWRTPEKGCLISIALMCWEQIEPSPKVSQQLNYNDWKQFGFLPQEICNVIILLFSNPSLGPPFVWPGTDWD